MVELATPIIKNLFESFGASRYVVALYDADGYHLVRMAQVDDLILREKAGLRSGLCFDERHMGTTGFGLAKRLKKPLRVIGCEHYISLMHHVSGVYAPIFEPHSREVVGVIAVSGATLVEYPQAESIVVTASTAIESLLELDRAKKEMFIYSKSLEMTVESLEDGLVLVDKSGVIREMNLAARQAIGLSYNDALNQNIADLALCAPLREMVASVLAAPKREVHQVECQLGGGVFLAKAKGVRQAKRLVQGVLIQLKNVQDLSRMLHEVTEAQPRYKMESLVGSSQAMIRIKELAGVAAGTEAPVIIEGESGTGKEVVAQAIHNAGARRWKPFVAVNCAAVPTELIESTIFGHNRGAFTGAVRTHIGKFELANGGTLFLDEIGDMPKTMQAKMLRAIEEGKIERVGSERPLPVDVRILSATNRDLLDLVQRGLFREDLFFRLNVFRIMIPASAGSARRYSRPGRPDPGRIFPCLQ